MLTFVYPEDTSIQFNRSVEPADFAVLGIGEVITVTVDLINDEPVDLRGFYFSDQVPNGWTVGTAGVSVDGSPVHDFGYQQGAADEIYPGFAPHRWTLELPQGGGVFSPTHPVLSNGGTAEIIYYMTIGSGSGGDYSLDHDGWAGWLETTPAGTAVFGYQYITSTVHADFIGQPRLGLVPLEVSFTDLSAGEVLTRTWDFGDGGSSFLANPVHTYTVPGTYTVSLTVQNSMDTDTVTRPHYIRAVDVIYSVYMPIILKSCNGGTCRGRES